MPRLADVLLAAGDSPRREAVRRLLENAEIHVVETRGEEELARHAARGDVAVVDLAAPDLDALGAVARLETESFGVGLPTVVLAADGADSPYGQALSSGADDLILPRELDGAFLPRLRPLFRLSTMRAELGRRRELALRHGVVLPAATPDQDPNPPVLLVVGGQEAGDGVGRAMSDDVRITVTADTFTAAETARDHRFDACVIAGSSDQEAIRVFCEDLRQNPSLFNLPVIVTGDAVPESALEAHGFGASRVMADGSQDALHFAIASLVRRQRQRWHLRQAMDAMRQGPVVDQATGTYTVPFLRNHLATLVAAAQAREHHLTLVFFAVPEAVQLRHQFGDESTNDLIRQLGSWIMGMVRAEDLVVHHGPHEFCVSLPDTPPEEAEIVMRRIAGILSHTDFALPDVYQPIAVAVEVGITGLRADDDPDSLIDRARERLA